MLISTTILLGIDKSSYRSYYGGVKAVGIKNLKNNLSRYLKEVQNGELVYVTDRDEIVAEIYKPTTEVTGKISRWEAFLNQEEKKGTLIRATRKDLDAKELLKKIPPCPKELEEESKKIYEEMRRDRF